MNDGHDGAAALRKARRKQTVALATAIISMIAVLGLAFVALVIVTATRALAERSFSTLDGNLITVRIVVQCDRIVGQVKLSGPRYPRGGMWMIGIPVAAGPTRDREARIDFDAESLKITMQVDGTEAGLTIVPMGGSFAFKPEIRPERAGD